MNRAQRRTQAPKGAALPILPQTDSAATLNLAVQYLNTGELAPAATLCRSALQANPQDPDALHLLGVIAHHHGNHQESERLIRMALERRPAQPQYLMNLGNTRLALKKTTLAIETFLESLRLNPAPAVAWYNLGNAHLAANNLDAAESAYREALRRDPSHDRALLNLGGALFRAKRHAEAVECFQQLLARNPNDVQALTNAASVLRVMGDLAQAAACITKAIELAPQSAAAYHTMGDVFHDFDQLPDAAQAYQAALSLDPNRHETYSNLGRVERLLGLPDQARSHFERGLQLGGGAGLAMLHASTMPVIPQSRAESEEARSRFEADVDALKAEGVSLGDPASEVGVTNFYLAYQGFNDALFQRKIAEFYLAAQPSLACQPDAGALLPSHRKARRKLRIGFVSKFLNRHTIGKFLRGFVGQLDRNRFEVAVIHVSPKDDDYGRIINEAADEVLNLRASLADTRDAIAAARLDVLCYAEIGMDPMTYFLAFSRLAPVQCVLWGHPDTTGIPNIDYFISAASLEPPNAQEHYTEQLVQLDRLPTYYYRPSAPAALTPRAVLAPGHEDAVWYVCPHNLFKLHPDFDAVLTEILERDPRGKLMLVEGVQAQWGELLRQRFAAASPTLSQRTVFLPMLGLPHFLSLLAQADALLDPIYFGGGNTSYEALALGAPIITWPGAFMRGRVTAACYQQMGVQGCVATTREQYVEMAVRLANDSAWRAEMSAAITNASGELFEDTRAVRALEQFFEQAVLAAKQATEVAA